MTQVNACFEDVITACPGQIVDVLVNRRDVCRRRSGLKGVVDRIQRQECGRGAKVCISESKFRVLKAETKLIDQFRIDHGHERG